MDKIFESLVFCLNYILYVLVVNMGKIIKLNRLYFYFSSAIYFGTYFIECNFSLMFNFCIFALICILDSMELEAKIIYILNF